MPVTLSDPGPGVLEVKPDGNTFKVIGDNLHVTVSVGAVVYVRGTPLKESIFMRITLRFNGGTNTPTVQGLHPVENWGPPPWTLDPLFSVFFDGGHSGYDFAIQWDYIGGVSPVLDSFQIAGVGANPATFNTVTNVRYVDAGSGATLRKVWGFELRMNSTRVFPVSGETCTITIRMVPI